MNKKRRSVNLVKVVDILSDGQYHDGESLGKTLQMTRSAVWKMIKKLTAYGIQVKAVKGKGYALQEPLILLQSSKIKPHLANEKINICIYEAITSTREHVPNDKQSKYIEVCLAEYQTQGRGRLNRTWYSPFGKNIYFSCAYPFQKEVSELSGLSLIVSLAVVKALKSYGIHNQLFVKWPNDIVYANKKISGSLIDIQAESHGSCYAVISIGINVNMLQDDGNQISQAWTSMQKILGRYIDRNELCSHLLTHLIAYIHQFEKLGFISFMKEWMDSDCLMHQVITLKNAKQKVRGKMTGINAQGHLLLQLSNGSIHTFSSGDTSISRSR